MNMNQFTQKTMAALQRAQSLAMEYQHMQVEQEHLMLALTESGQWQRAADTAGAYHETWTKPSPGCRCSSITRTATACPGRC